MDRNSIELNFQTAMKGADELDGVANDLERALKNEYGQSMAQLSRDWTGANAEFYQKKGVKLTEEIQDTISRIRSAAGEVRRTAQLVYHAEMAALAIAQARDY